MSEQLRHKMIDFTVAPPPTVWDAIAARLDDDKHYMLLSSKLGDFEAAPPTTAWENVAARLNDDKQYAAVSAKMNDFKASLPPGVWENIAARLNDDKQYAAVSSKMNEFEATPPTQVWGNVLNALEETKKNKAPVINMRRSIYRVAAAAVLVGIFIFGWLLINNKNRQKIEVAKTTAASGQTVTANNNKENKIAGDDSGTTQKVTNTTTQNNQSNIKRHHSFSPAGGERENTFRYATLNNFPNYKMPVAVINAVPILDKDGNPVMDIDVLTANSNYLVVTGPNGQLTRISSKFANVIRFLDDKNSSDTEEYLDRVIKESDTWKKRFQEWRNKISQSSYIPSSVNFLDIVELKDLIQEKQ
jgi:hypothetical protein